MNFTKRALTSAVLCALFLVVYGSCNWLSSLRSDVGMLYFEWERQIPFVPWLIIPYMSIDLFFIAAPFVCKTDAEVKTMARRIVFVIMVGGLTFLLFPLKFAFDRPEASGWLGVVFNNFRKMDQPFNLLPSLHIGLRTVLAAVYARHTKGLWRLLSNVWFSLIGISTLMTYQHHFLDVVGGFVVATFSFYLFREETIERPVLPNRMVACYYIGGALAVSGIGLALGSKGLVLLWPATSLALVGAAYLGLGPNIYHKRDGRLPWETRAVLAPTLCGQFLSLLYYRRQCAPWSAVTPKVWIGRKLNIAEAKAAIREGVVAVLDLTTEFDEAKPFRDLAFLNIPILDLTAPTAGQLREMARFIELHSSRGGVVYVHCKIGYSRSAAAVGAYLAHAHRMEVHAILERLRNVRPSIIIRREIVQALESYCRELKQPVPAG
jgi:protein-tyrosine phosphatase/membrane-associated phospholipid phosphatase